MAAQIINLQQYRPFRASPALQVGSMCSYKGALAQVIAVGRDEWFEVTVFHANGMFTCWVPGFRLGAATVDEDMTPCA